jgi:hypothetical protein
MMTSARAVLIGIRAACERILFCAGPAEGQWCSSMRWGLQDPDAILLHSMLLLTLVALLDEGGLICYHHTS